MEDLISKIMSLRDTDVEKSIQIVLKLVF